MPTDIRLPIPTGWIHVEPSQPDLLVMMSPPGPHDEGHAAPVAAISRCGLPASAQPPRERLLGVQRRLRDELTEILEWPETEDTDVLDLGGHDVSYLRISHQAAGHSLVTELWTWVLGGEEWTVTGTVPLEDYPTYCDVFESIADVFSPEEVLAQRRAG